ncbi:MAG: XdhC family protein [Halothiobacillaceae bacterium]|nr:XdhC family protein [Halothiobacillaceae bacterium]
MRDSSNPEQAEILILGAGEIARALAVLARACDLPVMVTDPQAHAHAWPQGVVLRDAVYAETPWPLGAQTHAVVARGHEGDPESVHSLLLHGVGRVYLIASARRAQNVLDSVAPRLPETAWLEKVSAPAGIDLGGASSADIALSILAEIQWRRQGAAGSLRPAVEKRAERLGISLSGQRFEFCPGQRA